ncbi:hypothetical protein [Clostridium sp.]|nr:hypothetical protein [Clostridium sp.]
MIIIYHWDFYALLGF